MSDGRRSCAVSSHQYYVEGMFHGWTPTGKAIVELRGGEVRVYDLEDCYSLKFTDVPYTQEIEVLDFAIDLPSYCNPVMTFEDEATGRRCAWVTMGGEDWLLYRHPSERHWVTWRQLTDRDRVILEEERRRQQQAKETN